jgi:aryl-alcohol dehydrogenase-like predicted oxidoreductase
MATLNQLSRLELALRFVSSVQGIDNIVIGVTKIRELEDIISTIKISLSSSIKTSQLRTEDKAVKTPSLWPPDTKDKWHFDFSVKKNKR